MTRPLTAFDALTNHTQHTERQTRVFEIFLAFMNANTLDRAVLMVDTRTWKR